MQPPNRYAWIVLGALVSCNGRETQDASHSNGTGAGGSISPSIAGGASALSTSGGAERGPNAANQGGTTAAPLNIGGNARGGQGAAVGGVGGVSADRTASLMGGGQAVTGSGGKGSIATTAVGSGGKGSIATTAVGSGGKGASGATAASGKGGATSSGGTTPSVGAGGASSAGGSAAGGVSPATAGAGRASLAAAGAHATRIWSTITVSLSNADNLSPAYTDVTGTARDAAPLPEFFRSTRESGSCRLLEPIFALCDPKCSSFEACIAEDTCVRSPIAVNMGTLVLRGLTLRSDGARDLTVEPINNSYSSSELAFPPCSPGNDVVASGGEDAATSFNVKASCIDPLVITDVEPIRFSPTEPVTFHWAMPTVANNTRIQIRVDISHHGGLKGLIVCDAPDNGSLTIDSNLVKSLIALGTAGFPTVRFTRLSTATVSETLARATLNVQATSERALAIPGLTSCSSEVPCPNGQSCVTYQCQ